MTPSDAVPVQLDFDLHGLVGIRLLDATESDARSVSAQLGPIQAHLDRDPDIVVRFVDRLRTGHVRLLGLDDAGFTDDEDWHPHDLPAVRSRIGTGKWARLAAVRAVHSMGKRLTEGWRAAAARTYRRALPVLERQLHVDVRPSELFGKGQAAMDAPFDRLIFVESHDDESIRVRPIEPDEIARRMEFSLAYERLDFMGYYHKFRFAFPDRVSPLVENAARIERDRLETVLRGKPAFSVSHPYPVSLPALYAAMEPVCR